MPKQSWIYLGYRERMIVCHNKHEEFQMLNGTVHFRLCVHVTRGSIPITHGDWLASDFNLSLLTTKPRGSNFNERELVFQTGYLKCVLFVCLFICFLKLPVGWCWGELVESNLLLVSPEFSWPHFSESGKCSMLSDERRSHLGQNRWWCDSNVNRMQLQPCDELS